MDADPRDPSVKPEPIRDQPSSAALIPAARATADHENAATPEGGPIALAADDQHPPRPAAALRHRALLVVAVVAFALLFALPWSVIAGAMGALAGTVVLAEALEQSGGLEPTTFGMASILGAVFGIGALGWALSGPTPQTPSDAHARGGGRFSAVLTVLALLTVFLLKRSLDGADTTAPFSTTVYLLDLTVCWIGIPLMVLGGCLRFSRWYYLVASRTPYRAGALTVAALTAALVFGPVSLLLAFGGWTAAVLPLAQLDGNGSAQVVVDDPYALTAGVGDLVDGTREILADIADDVDLDDGLTIADEVEVRLPNARPPFDDCLVALHGGSPSDVDTAIGHAVRRGLPIDVAEDIAHDSAVDVCVRWAAGAVRDYPTYYGATVRNRTTNARAYRSRFADCPLDIPVAAPPAGLLDDLHRGLCRLDADTRSAVLMRGAGHDYRTIAGRLGTSPATARQWVHRGRESLHEWFAD